MPSSENAVSRGDSPSPAPVNSNVPECIYLGDLCLTPTTTSHSADAPVTLLHGETRLESHGSGTSLTRRCSREASLRAFCFVVEMEENTGCYGWYYAPLEDYNRKKLRVDEAVVKGSLLEAAGGNGATSAGESCRKPASMYYRLPYSTTFRQLTLASTPSLLSTALASTGSMTSANKSALTSARIYPESSAFRLEGDVSNNDNSSASVFNSSSYTQRASLLPPESTSAPANTSYNDSPPPLAELSVVHNAVAEGHAECSSALRREVEAPRQQVGALDPDGPQPASLLPLPRYVDSDTATTAASSIAANGDGLALPLSITLRQSEEEVVGSSGYGEESYLIDGCSTPAAAQAERQLSVATMRSSTTSSSVPRCPPKLSEPQRPSGRRRQHQQQQHHHQQQRPSRIMTSVGISSCTSMSGSTAGGGSSLHPCDPAVPTSPTMLFRGDDTGAVVATGSVLPSAKPPVLGSSANGSCAGLTDQSTTYSFVADCTPRTEDPSCCQPISGSEPRASSESAKVVAATSDGGGESCSPTMLFVVNPFVPTVPTTMRPRSGGVASAQDEAGTRPVRAPVADGRARRLLQVPTRPSARRTTQPMPALH